MHHLNYQIHQIAIFDFIINFIFLQQFVIIYLGMNAIKINNLIKHFGKTKAVDNISFEIPQGEIFGFLGPNGAGKTTTIRLIMDFIRPNSGTIQILDHDAQKDTVWVKKNVGYLSSTTQLYDHWNGNDHIKLIENIRGHSEFSHNLIEKLNFNPRIRVKSLSTGNKQKLALILALMHRPKILILDEPTAGLDPILQNMIYEILREIQDSGTTIFMSSHNLHEVEEVCTRVGIIKEGKMVATESIANLKKKRLYSMQIYFDKSQKINLKDFAGEDNKIINSNTYSITLQVKEDINPILKKLNKYQLHDLEIKHASLEEIFLEFYK